MAGVFKSLDKADVRITPFRTYKIWSDVIGSGGSGSVYSVYQADYNPLSNYLNSDPLKDSFDQGNPYFEANEPTTINGKFKRVVHASIDHLYYRDFYNNNKASFGGGNINKQFRILEDKAQVISMPQSKFGEEILPSSINIGVSWSFAASSASSVADRSGSWNLIDDGHGNLLVSGSNYFSVYGEYVGGAYTNYTSSVTKPIAGEWPLDNLYKYVDVGPVSFTSSFNKGFWQMESIYTNISVTTVTGSVAPNVSDIDMLGAVMYFTASNSSSIQIKPNVVPDRNVHYNFENGDYSISMMVRPTQAPTHPSGSILLTKQGVVQELKVNENGDVYSQPAPNKFPYRLSYTSGSKKVMFEKSGGGVGYFALTSSVSMSLNTLHHIVATKTGSLITLHVNSLLTSSINSGSTVLRDSDTSNISNIGVGNIDTFDQGFNGGIDNLKIYKSHLTQNEVNILYHTLGVGNVYLGNAYYNHGMMILGSIPSRFLTINSVESRGTHTIYENEISCTISPGEFGMSTNRSIQEYDSVKNEFVYKSFVTGSSFKPFITTIGLYDDLGSLLVIGKLNTPIQTPNNMDTTIIVRYDR